MHVKVSATTPVTKERTQTKDVLLPHVGLLLLLLLLLGLLLDAGYVKHTHRTINYIKSDDCLFNLLRRPLLRTLSYSAVISLFVVAVVMRNVLTSTLTILLGCLWTASTLGAPSVPLFEPLLTALKRQDSSSSSQRACPSYVLVQTRGTNESQGPSDGFILANAFTLSTVTGGASYYTVYPAALDQISQEATSDILTRVAQFVQDDPTTCIILQGYSQGAAATVNALNELNGTSADAVKAVFLIGNPLRKPGLSCNVDERGANSTLDALGLQLKLFPDSNVVPDAFVNRTMDVCIEGDGICDSQSGVGYGSQGQHLMYGVDVGLQTMAYIFFSSVLDRGTYTRTS